MANKIMRLKLMAEVAASKKRIEKAERGIYAEQTKDLIQMNVKKVEVENYAAMRKEERREKSEERQVKQAVAKRTRNFIINQTRNDIIESFGKWDEFRERREAAMDRYIDVRKMMERVKTITMHIEVHHLLKGLGIWFKWHTGKIASALALNFAIFKVGFKFRWNILRPMQGSTYLEQL